MTALSVSWRFVVVDINHVFDFAVPYFFGFYEAEFFARKAGFFAVNARKDKMKFHFYTTLNDEEWATKDEDFKKYVSTVGSLTPDQCPSFYQQVDGVIFPSLLECFSATPLEAMVMTKPLFSSDRGFVRDVCGDYSLYFDPEDAADIAEKIANYFKSNIDYSERLTEARNHALNFSSARGRAEKYLEIIQQHIAD